MRGRLTIFLTVAVMLLVLAALNAASYVRVEQEGDSEFRPDRSTMNAGATGTRALYEYLQGAGYEVLRWGQPPSELLSAGDGPASFVIVGETHRPVEKGEAEKILEWVERGGRLVVIDRIPDPSLLPTSGRWRVASELFETPGADTRPDDAEGMTRGVPPVSPAQPTELTRDVDQVMRSRFASRLHVYTVGETPQAADGYGVGPPPPTPAGGDDVDPWSEEEDGPPPAAEPSADDADGEPMSPAPVQHLADGREGVGALLVDYAYGRGRVVILSDPFVVSNGGINRADNLILAANVVAGAGGPVAFDEFHQGYGAARNQLLAYFRNTPILWMFAQAALVVLAVVWTRGRGFARPLPAPHVDRRSKLEFVASMAELQQRARAYDLAVENIYARTRRALARYGGVAADAPLEQLAARAAARAGKDPRELEALLRECEDSIAGAPLNARRALALARGLRELERELGILMRSREIRQAEAK